MRIGFDTTPLYAPPCGVQTYTANLLDHLRAQSADENDEIVPLAHPPLFVDLSRPISHQIIHLNKLVSIAWMQAVLPWQLTRLGIDVCHFTNSVAPWWAPCPAVVTIYDMTLWLFPEHHSRRRRLARRPFVPRAARRARTIITISHCSKRDIVRILGVPEDKVQVIYPAPPPCFQPLPPGPRQAAAQSIRASHQLPERYVLYVGTLEPRKNLVRLLEAFAQLRRDGARGHGLVLVGCRGWLEAPIFAAVDRLGLGGAVRFLGSVPTETLAALYNQADALVFPSLYEGFGLPVTEAMACGTPVVTSRNGSLGEIAGDAAEFVEPTNVASIAAGLRRVLTDPARRAELRAKGLAQAARFSWAAAATQTRALYIQAAAEM